MYLMFLASGDDGGKVHLVEWRSEKQKVTDVEEEFQVALDEWSVQRPHMGDWSLIMALTVQGGKIVPVESEAEAPPGNPSRAPRILKAIKARLERDARS